MANTIVITSSSSSSASSIATVAMDSVVYEYTREVNGEQKQQLGGHLQVVGARKCAGGVEVTLRVNLTALGAVKAEGNKWAKAHLLIQPDMAGYEELEAYASATEGRAFKGGELVFAKGEKVNYYLLPVCEPDGWFAADIVRESDVVIEGVTHQRYTLRQIWWEGFGFTKPFHKLEVQRPVRRPRPF